MQAPTEQEKQTARIILTHTDKDSLAVLTGEAARVLLPLVHLPPNTLGKIWGLIDQESAGFLTFDQLTQFVRLIGYAQTNEPLTRSLLRKPGPECRIDGWTPNSEGTEKPPSGEEQVLLDALMKENDAEGYGILDGTTAKAVMKRSGLPTEVLGEIWELVDDPPKGFLTSVDLRRALRLISCAQRELKLHRRRFDEPCPLPVLDDSFVTPEVLASVKPPVNTGLIQSKVSAPAFPTPVTPATPFPLVQSTSTPRPPSDALPPLTEGERNVFLNIFNRSNPSTSNGIRVITGQQALPIFARSQLSTQILSQIWDLSDHDKAGLLTPPKFIIAMYLIKGLMDKRFAELPQEIPQWLRAAALQDQQPQPAFHITSPTPTPSSFINGTGMSWNPPTRYPPPSEAPPTHLRGQSQPHSAPESSLIDMDNEPIPIAPRASSAGQLSTSSSINRGRITPSFTETSPPQPHRGSEDAPPPYTETGRTMQA